MAQRDILTENGEGKPDFDTIVEKYADFVYNVAFRMMGKPEDAEDVSQEAFISAYRAYERFRGESRVTTWLYRITVNAALMRLRKEKRARLLTQTGLDEVDLVSWEPTPERSAVMSELGDKLREGIDMLPPDLRVAVILRDVEELSNAEAADVLGVSVSSIKSRLHRARILLRKYLSDYVKVAG
ncbi:MAG: sigma-70 family RNA polymerase sigma factor [Chloroflexi bacterium]|nr:sigma-70 family RNA polymerase sigma factor [Chloroflexota bacterium]